MALLLSRSVSSPREGESARAREEGRERERKWAREKQGERAREKEGVRVRDLNGGRIKQRHPRLYTRISHLLLNRGVMWVTGGYRYAPPYI